MENNNTLNSVPEEENDLQMEINADTQETDATNEIELSMAEPVNSELKENPIITEPVAVEEELKIVHPLDIEASNHIEEIEKTVHEEEDESEEDENQLQFNLEEIDNLSIEQLVELIEETVTHKVEKIKAKVSAIRNSYSAKIRVEKTAKKASIYRQRREY